MTKALAKARLKELETEIEQDVQAFVRVGRCLLEIKKDELWRETGAVSFPDYIDTRWQPRITNNYARKLIKASAIATSLTNDTNVPLVKGGTEGLLRPLAGFVDILPDGTVEVDSPKVEAAIERAQELADEAKQPISDKYIKKAVDEIKKHEKAASLPEPSRWSGQEGVFVGDATSREWLAALPSDTFDLMLTDPPWAKDSIGTYAAAGRAALKVLKPGGVCAIYLGKIYLPEVIKSVNEYLDYEWTFCLYYPESQVRIRKAAVYDCWRPVGIFRKPGGFNLPSYSRDLMPSPREKDTHDWQQSLAPAREFVRRYTRPGGSVLDPFVGGGTFPLAAKLEGRKYLAFDKNPDTVKIAAARLNGKI